MSFPQTFPTFNGDECSWADIGISFLVPGGQTLPLVDVESIKCGSSLDVGEQRGTSGGRVMKTTAGTEKTTGSMSITRNCNAILLEALEIAAIAAGAVRGDQVIVSAVRFDVLIQHTPLGDSRIYTTRMAACRYLGDADEAKQGNDADTIDVTLNPMQVLRKSATGKWLVLR